MSAKFPSIWLELTESNKSPICIAGFYRQWSSSTDKSEKMQIEQIKIFANQIDEKSKEYDKLIITGDSNLCANKWSFFA